MHALTERLDLDTLLPEETAAWCNQRLQDIGFKAQLDLKDDSKRPFADKFEILLKVVKNGYLPITQPTPISTGGTVEYKRRLQRNYLADPSLSGDPLPSAFKAQIAEIQPEDLIPN